MNESACPTPSVQLPSAIYVWLVRSEEVQDRPGSWRIRKWDTEPFPDANFTLSAVGENETPECPKGQDALVAGPAANGASGFKPERCASEETLTSSKQDTCQSIRETLTPDESNRQHFARSETGRISAGGAYELKLYGTPGYVGTIAGITVYADPEVPEHTVVIRDELGRELGRIINVGR